MKPFQLEAVLKQRKLQVDLAQKRLSQAQDQFVRVTSIYNSKRESYKKLSAEIVSMQSKGVLIHELLLHEEHSVFLKDEIVKINENLQTKKKIAEEAREHLISSVKSHKILAELKERQNAAYQQYLDKKENDMLDEIAVVRHGKSVL